MGSAEQGLLALWLDAEMDSFSEPQAVLAAAGFRVQQPRRRPLQMREILAADVLIVRVDGSGRGLVEQLAEWGIDRNQALPRPVIGRVPMRDIAVAVRILEEGASHALAADDMTSRSWQDAAQRIGRARSGPSFVFADPMSARMLQLAEKVARSDISTLLDGPTGAGKDVLARIIHEASPRADQPFVAFNCAALPEHLIEDTLFGHERGAFTGAVREHPGLFEQAHRGTLFLDEIGDMPLHLQAKLLRVLQERQCVRLGGTRPIHLDVRILAATHRDLAAAIRERSFREDLFFRLSTFRISVPSLAQRPGDVLPLARCFIAEHAPSGSVPALTAAAQSRLLAHPWPGNVRELQNVVQRALVLCEGEEITEEHLLFDALEDPAAVAGLPVEATSTALVAFRGPVASDDARPPARAGKVVEALRSRKDRDVVNGLQEASDRLSLQRERDAHEHETISGVLAVSATREEAAARLGISPRTLRYRLARLRDRGWPTASAS